MAKTNPIHAARAGLEEVRRHVQAGLLSADLHREIADICVIWMEKVSHPATKAPPKEQ